MSEHTRGKSKKAVRNNILPVRATDAEVQQIDDIAESQGLNRSEWMRQQFNQQLNDNTNTEQIQKLTVTLQKLSAELSAIGNNVNQIARQINTAVASGQDLPKYVNNFSDLKLLGEKIEQTNRLVKGTIVEIKPKAIRRKN